MSDDIERIVPSELLPDSPPVEVDSRPPLSLEGVDVSIIDLFQDEPIEMLLGMMPLIEEMMREDDKVYPRKNPLFFFIFSVF